MPDAVEIRQFPQPEIIPAKGEGRSSTEEVDFVGMIEMSSLGTMVPSNIRLGTLRDRRFRVQDPIDVKCSSEKGRIVAEALELNEFGFGENFSDAVADLQRAIVELYLTLNQDENRLGPDLEKVWATLQEKISAKL